MPEYLAPGVFVEEVSFRQKTIEGVSTSTTGFVGPTRFGPLEGEPPLITSFSEFERVYGGLDPLDFTDTDRPSHNYLAQAARAYFEEGGKRLHVARVYAGGVQDPEDAELAAGVWSDGVARWSPAGSPPADLSLRARYPGAAGSFVVTFVFKLGQNVLDRGTAADPLDPPVLRGAGNFDVVWAATQAEVESSPPGGEVYWLDRYFDEDLGRRTFRLRQDDAADDPAGATALGDVDQVRVLTVSVIAAPLGRFGEEQVWEDLTFHPDHNRSLSQYFAARPPRRSTELYVPLVFETALENGAAIAEALLDQPSLVTAGSPPAPVSVLSQIADPATREPGRTFRAQLAGGSDGAQPGAGDYGGQGGDPDEPKTGLTAFEDLEEISIVAAPGSTHDFRVEGGTLRADPITRLLVSHCERMRYRVAVLDSIDGQTPGEVLAFRGTLDSTRAAFYYPWVRVSDPVTEREILLPPSGFVSGIYARTDVDRGVHKAPANEVIRLAIGFERLLNKAQQEALNPQGVNCLRFFEGRGFRVWGARTASSDPEWKYLNVRRYFAYVERSIEKGTQWAVFEPNGELLWADVERTVDDFLFSEFKSGHLLGSKAEQAYFVRCDRTTMTQNDLDNGRLICLIGIAPLRPAEFVIFRIGQKTADARS